MKSKRAFNEWQDNVFSLSGSCKIAYMKLIPTVYHWCFLIHKNIRLFRHGSIVNWYSSERNVLFFTHFEMFSPLIECFIQHSPQYIHTQPTWYILLFKALQNHPKNNTQEMLLLINTSSNCVAKVLIILSAFTLLALIQL